MTRSGPAGDAPAAPDVPVHFGWVVVGAAFGVLFLAYGVQYSFGLFFTALTREFGWSRASLSGVFSVYAGLYSFLGLVSGRLTDRWGPRRVVAAGGVLLGLGLALAGTVHGLAPLYAAYLVAALGMSTTYVPCNATVARWFVARRGLAVGLAMSGAGVGIFVCPPVVAVLLDRLGWRASYAVLGGGLALAFGGLSRLLVHGPATRGLAPYGAATKDVAPHRPAADHRAAMDWPVARALRHPPFLALAGVYAATWVPVFMPLVHLVPLASDLGLSPVVGASALSSLGIGSLAGRLGLPALSDVIGRRPALAISLALQAAGFAGLALAGGAAGLIAAAAVYGFSYGAVTALMPPIVTDFYGAGHAGSLVGVIFGAAGAPGALGPLIGGLLFDATGTYAWAFGVGAAFNVVALGLLMLARPPRSGPREPML